MEDKITAVYVMVRNDELRPEDNGSFEALLELQKHECLGFLEQTVPEAERGPVEVYTRRSQLLMDLDRERIRRVVAKDPSRLGSTPEELEGIQFELNAAGVPLLTVQPS
jgi:hypothetical protein